MGRKSGQRVIGLLERRAEAISPGEFKPQEVVNTPWAIFQYTSYLKLMTSKISLRCTRFQVTDYDMDEVLHWHSPFHITSYVAHRYVWSAFSP
jgi:hypothetical protein